MELHSRTKNTKCSRFSPGLIYLLSSVLNFCPTYYIFVFLQQNVLHCESMSHRAMSIAQQHNIVHSNDPSEMLDNITRGISMFNIIPFYHSTITGLCIMLQRTLVACVTGNIIDGKCTSDVLFLEKDRNYSIE